MFELNLKNMIGDKARLPEMDKYLEALKDMPLDGEEVVLTGEAPIWLYLKVAHALHGHAKKLYYKSRSLRNGVQVLIFDHDPY